MIELGANDIFDDDSTLRDDGVQRPFPGIGYDDLTGWGRADATYTTDYVTTPDYKILHFYENSNEVTMVHDTVYKVETDEAIPMEENYWEYGFYKGEYQEFKCDVYKVVFKLHYNLPTNYSTMQLSSYEPGGVWPLHAETNLLPPPGYDLSTYDTNVFYKRPDNTLWNRQTYLERTWVDKQNDSVSFTGYIYHVKGEKKNTDISWTTKDYWLPFSQTKALDSAIFGFTVHAAHNTYANTESILNNQLQVFPNPAQNLLGIQSKQALPRQLYVYNASGQQVYAETLVGDATQHILDISTLQPGMYLLHLNGEDNTLTKKFIISR
ncbi:MAG: T9SS type A sorting domain-containing protein [Bacteroidetes bacterium]|nr:T9SS type A sorting domain-containing protein [Bacteroidota bacterium]